MKSRVATVPSKAEPEHELTTAPEAASTNKTIRPGEKKQPQLSLTAVAAAAGAVIAFWVVSFPRCVVMHPVGECEWLGFRVTCLPAIDRDGPWNFHLAHWLLASVLFTIGVANATRVNTQQNYVTTAATAGYALVTSSFAVFRAQFGLSKPLLIGAALHNLFEWVFVATVTYPTLAAKKQFVAKAAAWIFLVVLAVALVPDIKVATIMEQSVGIMLDFFLVLAYFELAITGRDADVRSFYLLPFVAAATHLFCTILPLVFANFAVGSTGYFVVVNEAMIYVSPVVTHTIYFVWGQRFDARCNSKGDIDQRFVVDGTKRRMLAAFAIGFIPLVGISSHAGSCQAPTVLTGTTIARVHPGLGDAFVDRIAHFNLVETAKDTPGCVDYVLTRSIQNPNEFRFIEKWESAEAVTHWIEHGLPAQLFHADAAMQQLLVGGQLQVQGAYMDVQSRRAVAHGGFAFPLGSPCSKVWNVVGNWSDCSWVVGCTHAHVVNATTRTLHIAAPDGQLARHLTESLTEHFDDDMALTYGYPGYEATVQLAANATSGGCVATYAFRTDGGAAQVEAIYKDFLSHRIPVLQQQFNL